MADNANKLLQDNVKLTNEVIKANKDLVTQLVNNKKVWSDLLAAQKAVNTGLKNSKTVKEYADAQKKLTANINATAQAEKKQIEINGLLAREQEKVKREILKTTTAQNKAKQAASTAGAQYKKLSRDLTTNRNKAKDLALQYGLNSKEFKKAQAEVLKLDSRLKKVDSSLGQNQRSVGNYKKALGGVSSVMGAFGLAAISAQTAIHQIGKAIKGNQATGDEFDKMIAGWNAGIDVFYKNIARGDFDSFFSDIKNAIDAGREYASTLDDLGDRERALKIATSEYNVEISKQEDFMQDVTRRDEERLAASQKVADLRIKVFKEEKEEARRLFDAEVEYATKITGFEKDRMLSFLRNYREEEDIRNSAIELYDKEIEVSRNAKNVTTANQFSINALTDKLVKSQKELDELRRESSPEVKDYYTSYNQYLKTNDGELNKVVDSYVNLQKTEDDYFKQSKRNTARLSSFQKQINADIAKRAESEKKVTPIIIEEIKKREDIQLESFDTISTSLVDNVDVFKRIEEEKTKIAKEEAEKRSEVEADLLNSSKDLVSAIGNSIFESKTVRLDDELEAVAKNYDDQIALAEGDEDKTRALEAQREAEENRIAAEKRSVEKKQFLFSQAIKLAEIAGDTATGVTKAVAQFPVTAGQPFVSYVLANGLVQAGIVAAQSIPQFDKGTSYLPALSEVAEKRSEFVTKNGKTYLFDKPTVLGEDWKGAKVTSGAETAQIINNSINNDFSTKKQAKGQELYVAALVTKEFEKHSNKMVKAIDKGSVKSKTNIYRTNNLLNKFAE